MKKLLGVGLLAIVAGLGAPAGLAQGPVTTQQVTVTPSPSVPLVTQFTATPVVPGSSTAYYWVVSYNGTQPSAPVLFTFQFMPATISATQTVALSWVTPSGVTAVDVLRTPTAAPPSGACNCAVVSSSTAGRATDNGTLGAYTVSTNGLPFVLQNTVVGGAQEFQIIYNGNVLFPCTVSACGGAFVALVPTFSQAIAPTSTSVIPLTIISPSGTTVPSLLVQQVGGMYGTNVFEVSQITGYPNLEVPSSIYEITGLHKLYFEAGDVNGSTAVGFQYVAVNQLSTAGAELVQWINNATLESSIDFNGAFTSHYGGAATAAGGSFGGLRLTNTDKVCWRNAGNTADICQVAASTAQVGGAVDLTAQGANIGSTAVPGLSSATAGKYLVSCYTVVTRAATTSSTLPFCEVTWTDQDTSTAGEASVQGCTNTANLVGSLNFTSCTNVNPSLIGVANATSINYLTSGYVSSGATSMQYAVHVRIVYLGP